MMPRYSLRTLLSVVTIAGLVSCYLASALRAIGGGEATGLRTWALACAATFACVFGVLMLVEAGFVLLTLRFERLQKVLAACVLVLAISILAPLNALVFIRFERVEPFMTLAFVVVQGCSFGVITGGLLAASAFSRRGRV